MLKLISETVFPSIHNKDKDSEMELEQDNYDNEINEHTQSDREDEDLWLD